MERRNSSEPTRGEVSGFFLKIPILSLKSTAGCGLCSGTVIEKTKVLSSRPQHRERRIRVKWKIHAPDDTSVLLGRCLCRFRHLPLQEETMSRSLLCHAGEIWPGELTAEESVFPVLKRDGLSFVLIMDDPVEVEISGVCHGLVRYNGLTI